MADLWYVRTAEVHGVELMRACNAILMPDERKQQRARAFDEHRHEYLVTRALCRAVLGHRLGVAPAALRFERNPYGRPVLDPPSSLRFNLTNTTEFVAIAVADGQEIGVDAEPTWRADTILDVASSVFTVCERTLLDRMSMGERRTRAIHLWTLKEAYIKARGKGFAIPVDKFEIDFTAGAPALRFLDPLDEYPARWQLEVRAIDEHVVATCVERSRGRDVHVAMHHAKLSDLLVAPVQRRSGG